MSLLFFAVSAKVPIAAAVSPIVVPLSGILILRPMHSLGELDPLKCEASAWLLWVTIDTMAIVRFTRNM